MLRQLRKPLRRRIRDLVVTITVEGLELRRCHKQRSTRYTWEDLINDRHLCRFSGVEIPHLRHCVAADVEAVLVA